MRLVRGWPGWSAPEDLPQPCRERRGAALEAELRAEEAAVVAGNTVAARPSSAAVPHAVRPVNAWPVSSPTAITIRGRAAVRASTSGRKTGTAIE